MKKKISFALALIMILGIFPMASFAEENYDEELKDAILKSKEIFNIGEEYDEFDESVGTMDGYTVFYLNWSSSKDNLGDVNVAITSDGTILNYTKWDPSYGEQEIKIPDFTREEGLEKVEKFIEKVSPGLADSIIHIDTLEPLNINDSNYRYKFARIENDVPYYNNHINISLDTSKGEVWEYSTKWDWDMKFENKDDILSLEEAKDLYKEKIGLELIYKSSYSDGKPKAFLVYGLLNEDLGIKAKDGELAPIYDDYPIYGESLDMEAPKEEAIENELSPDELKAIEGIEGLVSKEEAEKIGREILEIDSDYLVKGINLYTDWRNDDQYLWEMNFMKELDSKEYYANISIDAKTKKLLSLYNDGGLNMEEKAKFSKEESLEIAKEFIEKFNPDDYESIELREDIIHQDDLEETNIYNYEFIRKIDNAYVEEDGVSISVDAVNGKVTQYRLNWSKKDFPSKDNIISLEKAYDVLFNDIGLELKYTPKESYNMNGKEEKEAILVYGLKDNKPTNIDARTGSILNYNGEPYKETIIADYKDIENSYAKDKIRALARYGISLPGERYRPKEEIKQKDFLYLLAKAKYPYFNRDESRKDMYEYLVNEGIVKEDEKDPEAIVTKEEGAKYVIRAMDYGKVADLNEIYKDLFEDTKDIDPELKGYMSIAYGLEIIDTEDNKLNPKKELKREDGASMIYNYLFGEN